MAPGCRNMHEFFLHVVCLLHHEVHLFKNILIIDIFVYM
jgi:hypothetical protein